MTTSKHRTDGFDTAFYCVIRSQQGKKSNLVNFDWIWINNAHIDQRLTVKFFFFSCINRMYSHLYLQRWSFFFFSSHSISYEFSVYEWLNGLWRKWNTLLMWIMKWHQKVFFCVRHIYSFFLVLFKFYWFSMYELGLLTAVFCIFSNVAHPNFYSVLVLSKMM